VAGLLTKLNKMHKILICILLQIVLFIPFYLIWRNDCKKIGKDNLAGFFTGKVFILANALPDLVIRISGLALPLTSRYTHKLAFLTKF